MVILYSSETMTSYLPVAITIVIARHSHPEMSNRYPTWLSLVVLSPVS